MKQSATRTCNAEFRSPLVTKAGSGHARFQPSASQVNHFGPRITYGRHPLYQCLGESCVAQSEGLVERACPIVQIVRGTRIGFQDDRPVSLTSQLKRSHRLKTTHQSAPAEVG